MYDKFSDRARKVMQLANQEAQRFNHDHIDTPHLLLALLKEGSGLAFNVLTNLGVTMAMIRLHAEHLLKPGPEVLTMGKLPQTADVMECCQIAEREARALGHGYVGTEHLLLALTVSPEKTTALLIGGLGLTPERIRNECLDLLEKGVKEPESSPADHSRGQTVKINLKLEGDELVQLRTLCERLDKLIAEAHAAEARLRKLLNEPTCHGGEIDMRSVEAMPLDEGVMAAWRASGGGNLKTGVALEPVGIDADGEVKPIAKLSDYRAAFAQVVADKVDREMTAGVETCTNCLHPVQFCDDHSIGPCPGKVKRDRKRLCIVITCPELLDGCEIVSAAEAATRSVAVETRILQHCSNLASDFCYDLAENETAFKIRHHVPTRAGSPTAFRSSSSDGSISIPVVENGKFRDCRIDKKLLSLDGVCFEKLTEAEQTRAIDACLAPFGKGPYPESMFLVPDGGAAMFWTDPEPETPDPAPPAPKSEGDSMADFFKKSTHER